MNIKIRLEKERLEERLKILEKDYKGISSDYNLAHDRDEKNRLESKLKMKLEEIQKVEQELNELKNELKIYFIKQLIIILEPHFKNEKDMFLHCYKQSLPDISIKLKISENVTEIISSLLLPTELESYSYVYKFVLYLLLDEKVSPHLKPELQAWANENIKNLAQLSAQLTEEKRQKERLCNPCLMVAITTSKENDYILEAWLIKNLAQYDRKSLSNCEQLKIDNKVQIPINKTLDNLPQLVRNLIYESSSSVSIKKIQIFLPIELMNHPVDCWKMYENEDETIGETYQICIRCSEGLRGKNPRLRAWRDKGRLISDKLAQTAADIFIVGDNKEFKTLEKQLKKENAIAAKIVPVFQNNLPGEILWKAGVPLALWVRQELPDIENIVILDELINDGCLEELPERVKVKRLDAMDQNPPENHVGRHLCLLWDDPNFLPPEALLAENQL